MTAGSDAPQDGANRAPQDSADLFVADFFPKLGEHTGAGAGAGDADQVREYLKQVGKVPGLTAEQEAGLAKRIEAGLAAEHKLAEGGDRLAASERIDLEWVAEVGTRARNNLLEANLRLVVALAKRFTGRGLPLLDLIQEGNLGLIRAVEKFDYTKGYRFSTYATWWIRQAITKALAGQPPAGQPPAGAARRPAARRGAAGRAGAVSGPRVAVAGGGLGGLCLAQGLLKAGIDVTVYERDARLASRRQGYRLHVDARAGLALEQCLPPESLALFQATCGDASTRLTVVSERLRVLNEQRRGESTDPYAPATLSTSVNRQTLREVLAAGLDGRLVFGCELTGYEAGQDGVRLRFADGRQAEADLLVGANGVGSAVRRQYLPAAAPADTGTRCVYGKTPLGPADLDGLPFALRDGFTAVVGGQIGMATGLVRFRQRPERAAPWLSPAGDYLMWAVAGDGGRFGVADERLTAMSPAELHALTAKLIRSWHPDLRALHARAAVDETFLVRIRTSPPVPPWPPSRVTLLGDAIHAMSPARGSGANTALQDAALLCRTLTGAGGNGTRTDRAGGREQRCAERS